MSARYPHLDLCEVSSTSSSTNSSVHHGEGVLWRFLPLADPSVELFISRDLDSLLGQRESDAVQEWIKSGKTIHVMRDHPLHSVSILAGAWGARNHRSDIYRPLRERLVTVTDTAALVPGEDQLRLEKFVYGPAVERDDVLEHDSYFCGLFGPSRPFPSRRYLSTYPHFVGDRVMFRDYVKEMRTNENWLFYIRKCPEKCRPSSHLDWLWC
ncbi:uncharacterized protein LOC122394029 [Amphibalanus amphitrite]|uniref:uncharacterized protein LOC122394029 n=1 Tax=Amphibalanus amphitrite TaxID=1232801 RepID=UPI001C90503A|nr:uncharacterized protein LOC122394029 [Amphibalanus amphitrite]